MHILCTFRVGQKFHKLHCNNYRVSQCNVSKLATYQYASFSDGHKLSSLGLSACRRYPSLTIYHSI